jgi:hypothetical protein
MMAKQDTGNGTEQDNATSAERSYQRQPAPGQELGSAQPSHRPSKAPC